MSVPTPEVPEAVELPSHGDAAFGALMDALAPEPGAGGEAAAPAGEGGAAAATPAAGSPDAGSAGDGAAGSAPAGDAGAGAEAGAAAPGEGAAGAGAAGGDQGAADGGAAQPAATGGAADQRVALDAAVIVPELGKLSTALEESATKAYQSVAFEEVRTEYSKYFEALNQHPRLLVGTQVPAIGKEGMETLRDTDDAREWQEAVKHILAGEVNDRVSRALDENADFLQTVHASIDLFKNNVDLIPNTQGFDRELADRFATLAAPYELRVEGKLQGYSIPVQPIIDQLRTQIAAERKAKAPAAAPAAVQPPTPAAGATGTPPAAVGTPTVDAPQAGIPSKAGASGDPAEDFSTLFGTIGLPNLRF